MSSKGLKDLIEHAPDIISYAQARFPYGEGDAYEALMYAYEILRALKVI